MQYSGGYLSRKRRQQMKEGIFNIADLPHDVSTEIENGKIDINMQVLIAIDHGTWYEKNSYSPESRDEMVARLFDLSLTHVIVEMEGNYISCIDFILEPDSSGGTNLDADIIELIVEWVRRR